MGFTLHLGRPLVRSMSRTILQEGQKEAQNQDTASQKVPPLPELSRVSRFFPQSYECQSLSLRLSSNQLVILKKSCLQFRKNPAGIQPHFHGVQRGGMDLGGILALDLAQLHNCTSRGGINGRSMEQDAFGVFFDEVVRSTYDQIHFVGFRAIENRAPEMGYFHFLRHAAFYAQYIDYWEKATVVYSNLGEAYISLIGSSCPRW